MIHHNRWPHGAWDFHFPNFVDGSPARLGCTLQRAVLDPSIGEEVLLLFREESRFVRDYERVSPFNLLPHFGVTPTPQGMVGYIVWRVAAGSAQEVLMDQYLNPYRIETLRLVASAANQSHFKLLIVDNGTGAAGAFVDFENVFNFASFATRLVLAIGRQPEGDFAAGTDYVMRTMTVGSLVARAALEIDVVE